MRMPGGRTLRRIGRRVRRLFVPEAVILAYHRVADLPTDPQLLAVSPAHFAEHLRILREQYAPISLREMLQKRGLSPFSVVVTFDDGYADNLHEAKPLLAAQQVPATVFVTSGMLDSTEEFWWDELERLVLLPEALPKRLEIDNASARRVWELGPASGPAPAEWNVLQSDASPRQALYRELRGLLSPLPQEERKPLLQVLRQWSGAGVEGRPTHRALAAEELHRLAEGGLVEIGAHTVNHICLGGLPRDVQRRELAECKTQLERVLGQSVSALAYPYGAPGDFTEDTVSLAREAGFTAAVTTSGGTVCPRFDPYRLPRSLVRNWDAETFARKLHDWFNS